MLSLYPEEAFEHRGHHDKEDAGAEPAAGHLSRVRLARTPFVVDLYRADKAGDRPDGIHQVRAGREIALYLVRGFGNTGITILGPCRNNRCQDDGQ